MSRWVLQQTFEAIENEIGVTKEAARQLVQGLARRLTEGKLGARA